jgi:hypothetical protein
MKNFRRHDQTVFYTNLPRMTHLNASEACFQYPNQNTSDRLKLTDEKSKPIIGRQALLNLSKWVFNFHESSEAQSRNMENVATNQATLVDPNGEPIISQTSSESLSTGDSQ